jgi:hypothetical protein
MTETMAIDNGLRRNGLRPFVWCMAGCLLLLPALAMQFFPASGVNWSGFDFAVMGAMLATACGLYELGAWLSGNTAYRAGFGLAVLAAFLTVWVNLAVGMLGSENDIINLVFAVVLFVAALGGLIAGLKPAGMARAMAATAVAQLLAVGVGLSMREFEPRELVLSAMFALPWLASAALFRKAAQGQTRAA